MLKSIKMAAMAAVVSLTGMVGATPSIAQDVEFLIGPDGVRVRSSEYCDTRRGRGDPRCDDWRRRDDRRDGRWDRRDDRRDDRWDRRGRVCETRDALRKASDRGVRRARVVDVGRRTIRVAGFGSRGRVVYTFGRQPGCPVIDRDYL